MKSLLLNDVGIVRIIVV